MIKKFKQWSTNKKKDNKEPQVPTIVSSPLKGQNQDQSGINVSNSSTGYTISDEVQQEATHQGHNVPLNTKMRGDVKKFKVYVKDGDKVKKVNYGDPNMRIRKSNPKARKSFRARHHCENPGPKTKARYWSCRNW